MKLHFKKGDSLYYIFKTIKKVPSYKSVEIFIEPDHGFFLNERRGKQLHELIQTHAIKATCIVSTPHTHRYFEAVGIPTQVQYKHLRHKRRSYLGSFFNKGKKIHRDLLFKHKQLSQLVVLSEILVIGIILYFFWGLISPNANLIIKPAYHIENIVYNFVYYPEGTTFTGQTKQLTIPYTHQSIPYIQHMKINVQNLSYTIENAYGKLKVVNLLPESYSLLKGTQLTDSEGNLFTFDNAVFLPAASETGPGVIYTTATAASYDSKGEMMGDAGNIVGDTELWIKNLPESLNQSMIYAVAVSDFVGGEIISTGSIVSEDIDNIEQKITDYMHNATKEKIQETFQEPEQSILLFDELIDLQVNEFITTSHVGDATTFVEGKVSATIHFPSVRHSDIIDRVDTFLQQRPNQNSSLLNYDINSLTFYTIHEQLSPDVFSIPTKLNVVRGYDFEGDANQLVPELLAKIAGLDRQQAEQLLLDYEQVEQVDIRISPPRYDILPQTKSRIHFSSQAQNE